MRIRTDFSSDKSRHTSSSQKGSSETLSDNVEPSQRLKSAQFHKLEQEVYEYWPTASLIPKNSSTLSLFDYSEQQVRTNTVANTSSRREEFRSHIRSRVKTLLGQDVADSIYRQLENNHSFSTAQHYTTLSSRTLNPTLQTSLAYFDRTEPERQNVLVLACSGISFNNPWFARGHSFHSMTNEKIEEYPLTFFGRAFDPDPIVFTKPYTTQTQKAIEKLLTHYRSEKLVKKREFNKIGQFIEETLFTPHILSQKYYIDQVTITKFHLWKQIFSTYQGNVPNLIFLSQEKIASELIKEFHLTKNTILHNVLFNKSWHELIYKYFDNIMCAFSVERQYGTFLFWRMTNDGKTREQLFMKNGTLVSPSGYMMEMTPENIQNALSKDELLPSTMLTFLVLGMYYGYSLAGGLDQPTYLTQTKYAYIQMLHELGLSEEVSNCEPIITSDIVISRPTLAFLKSPTGERVPASGLDLLLYGSQNSWPTIMNASKNIPLKEFFYRLYPELYKDYCEHSDKDNFLLSVTEQEVEKYTGIDKKIPAWATLG